MKLCLSGDGLYFNLNDILTGLKIDFEQFQRICVLAGCDYLKNIRGLWYYYCIQDYCCKK